MTGNDSFPGIGIVSIDIEETEGEELSDKRNAVQALANLFGALSGDYTELIYTLDVAAMTEVSAKSKARSFVRLKNVFEPSIVDIRSIEKTADNGLFNTYRVVIDVEK